MMISALGRKGHPLSNRWGGPVLVVLTIYQGELSFLVHAVCWYIVTEVAFEVTKLFCKMNNSVHLHPCSSWLPHE